MGLRVLSLVTNHRARFYKQQVDGLRTNGVAVRTLTVPGSPAGDESRSIPDYARLYLTALWASRNGYDLIHANYGLTAPPAVAQPWLPSVVSLWGSDLLGKYGRVGSLCARCADEVVVMSPQMAEALSTDSHVIPHGIDLDRFQPQPQSAAQRKLGWDPEVNHLLFPYPPTRTVKDYPRAERIVEAVDKRGGHPVELHSVSGVPHERVAVYMNAADVLLLTSTREGSPNSVKEALACNLPVVATDVGDVRERLTDVSPSAVSDDDEELISAVGDILSADTRSNGREIVADISHGRQVERLIRVYEEAVANS